MIIGYARVSTDDQRLDMQLAALKDAGCDKLFQDHGATGSNMDRPGLEKVLRALKPGDTLVVWRLDRLGRSLTDLVRFIEELGERGCEFRSLNEAIDTSTSGGRLIFHIMAAFAEFERNLISERTRAGLIAARQRGRRLGRPPIALSDCDLSEARRALVERRERLGEIAARYRVSPSTLRRRLSAEGQERREPSQRPRNGAGRARPVQRRSAVVQKLMGSTFTASRISCWNPRKTAVIAPAGLNLLLHACPAAHPSVGIFETSELEVDLKEPEAVMSIPFPQMQGGIGLCPTMPKPVMRDIAADRWRPSQSARRSAAAGSDGGGVS
ncbi:recombinase family protein [Paracoccus kondratievae]|uniref:Resolvase/invertase-type recombinase catalytic domain-containing protein n=1 Tax=Paracoccus kondratievae TaxID=135740 RepID=A0AAD3RSF2_9RHOB|nr:recombinase family protein [Paracoccus kondratievae]GLK63343.1 hypothetical protein GCM10017635_08130 [Paracoccus kondratievae]